MMVVDQDGVCGLEGVVAQEPSAGVLQHLRREIIDALAHGRQPEVGAMRDQGGEQRAVWILVAWL